LEANKRVLLERFALDEAPDGSGQVYVDQAANDKWKYF
jgi:hypothetical protein